MLKLSIYVLHAFLRCWRGRLIECYGLGPCCCPCADCAANRVAFSHYHTVLHNPNQSEIISNSKQIDTEDSIEKSEDHEPDPKATLEQKPDTIETQNALDSVRDAVSQSIIKSDNKSCRSEND